MGSVLCDVAPQSAFLADRVGRSKKVVPQGYRPPGGGGYPPFRIGGLEATGRYSWRLKITENPPNGTT